MEIWIVVWRSANVLLATAGLLLLLDDVRVRRSLRLRQRFYWQAVALLLISTGWGTVTAIVERTPFASARSSVVTVALVYFLISILQVRRFNRREEQAQLHGRNGGLA